MHEKKALFLLALSKIVSNNFNFEKVNKHKNLVIFFRCLCEHCHTQNRAVVTEYRCCRKMAFDGSIEKIKCITELEDYDAISTKAVLLLVAPLLRNKDGKGYCRRAGISETSNILLFKQ